MDAEELKKRMKHFGLGVIRFTHSLPSSRPARIMGDQLMRSGTSLGANYHSACRARTKPDFISKTGIALEDADESLYWMEMLVEAGLTRKEDVEPLMQEANEIVAILTASVQAAGSNLQEGL